ncbi:hypothetical protein QJ48_31180 [Paenibacillus sp. A3]|nr:hypothetical protein QJ48_31180 [Paenibacillus sp. A3]
MAEVPHVGLQQRPIILEWIGLSITTTLLWQKMFQDFGLNDLLRKKSFSFRTAKNPADKVMA